MKEGFEHVFMQDFRVIIAEDCFEFVIVDTNTSSKVSYVLF